MNIAQAWESRFRQRYRWLKNAEKQYVESFSNESVRQLLSNSFSGSANVAMYGKTQVGKTTLILSLLGVKQSCFVHLAELLRCGSTRGHSATPTAFIYRMSHDNHFHVRQEGQAAVQLTEDDARVFLTDIRRQVETNQCSGLSEIYLDIPAQYFDNSDVLTNINILDLPGVFSKNKHEQEHTCRLIRKFLPVATLILIVERGNQIANLNDLFGNKLLDSIYNWHFLTDKFRLITTFSLTAESVRENINSSQSISVHSICKLYKTECIKSLGALYPESLRTYHLEFGDSWESFINQTTDSALRQRYETLLQLQWQQLRQDINDNATELSQVSMSKKVPHAITKLKDSVKQTMEISLSKCGENISSFKKDIDLINSRIGILKQEINGETKNIEIILKKVHFVCNIQQYAGSRNKNTMTRHIESVLRCINDAIEESRNGALECSCDISKDIARIGSHAETIFKDIYDKLNLMIFNKPTLVFGLGGPSEEDHKELLFATQKIIEYIDKKARDIESNRDTTISTVNNSIARHEKQIVIQQRKMTAISNQLTEAKKHRKQIESDFVARLQELDNDFKAANRFNLCLSESLTADIANISTQIATTKSHPIDKLFDICLISLCSKDYQSLEISK